MEILTEILETRTSFVVPRGHGGSRHCAQPREPPRGVPLGLPHWSQAVLSERSGAERGPRIYRFIGPRIYRFP